MSSQKHSKKNHNNFLYSCNFVVGTMFLCAYRWGQNFVAHEKQTTLIALGLCNFLLLHPCKGHQGPVPENDVLFHTSPIPTYLQYPFSFQAPSLLTEQLAELCVPAHKQVHAFWFTGQETKAIENQWAWGPFSGSPFSNSCSSPTSVSHLTAIGQ